MIELYKTLPLLGICVSVSLLGLFLIIYTFGLRNDAYRFIDDVEVRHQQMRRYENWLVFLAIMEMVLIGLVINYTLEVLRLLV